MDKLLTSKEAASIIGINDETLRMWRTKKKGPAFIKLGHAVRYTTQDIESWIDSKRKRHE